MDEYNHKSVYKGAIIFNRGGGNLAPYPIGGNMGKPNYDKDGPFGDPIVRCCDCSKIVYRTQVQKFGQCPKCGNRRVRNVSTLSEEEMAELKKKDVDPEFLALFEGVSDV